MIGKLRAWIPSPKRKKQHWVVYLHSVSLPLCNSDGKVSILNTVPSQTSHSSSTSHGKYFSLLLSLNNDQRNSCDFSSFLLCLLKVQQEKWALFLFFPKLDSRLIPNSLMCQLTTFNCYGSEKLRSSEQKKNTTHIKTITVTTLSLYFLSNIK